jgi:hypothetical protein
MFVKTGHGIEDSLRQDHSPALRCGVNVRNLLSFYIRSLTPWKDYGKHARYPFERIYPDKYRDTLERSENE